MSSSCLSAVIKLIYLSGGHFELGLANYDSHSPVPTRTIGDRHTGTDVPRRLELIPITFGPSTPGISELPPALDRSGSSVTVVAQINQAKKAQHSSSIPIPRSSLSQGYFPGPSEMQPSATSPRPASPPPKLHVLVVDDDAITRTLMKRMLTRYLFSVSSQTEH